MLVGVCDFPSDYAFPPTGYGGIERWLWAAAVGARRAGATVHLLGPRWRAELADHWTLRPVRLEDLSPTGQAAAALRDDGYDLLVVGHEYPSLPAWRAVADTVGAQIATFQHSATFTHQPAAFDGRRSRLYTYSDEMRARYAAHHPTPELAVHLGLGEAEPPASPGDGLLWLGRIDAEKAPHLAIRAAALLGRHITLAGPIFDSGYVDQYRHLFTAPHVTLAGEIAGQAKSHLIANARALLYTCARDYIEAGAATFGEALRAGTPAAALAWRHGTCAQAALCPDSGAIALADPDAGDEATARALADATEHAATLKASEVQDIGVTRFDPERHFHALAATQPC
jgi:hypothetical protein